MKKIIIGLGLALLIPSAVLQAQSLFQRYYQWLNILNVDHGTYNKVKTRMNGTTAFYYAVGSATNPQNGNWHGTLSCIDGSTGNLVYSKIITPPFTPTQRFEVVSLAISESATPTLALLCNHRNTTGVNKTVLIKTDLNGVVLGALDLGNGKGVDVIYNPSIFGYVVLSEVTTAGNSDFELTGVDEIGFTQVWARTFNWGQFDIPAALVIDNGDVVAAGTSVGSSDRQILMVKTDAVGNFMWGQAFGSPSHSEVITDVVFYLNAENQFRYGFSGYDSNTQQALVGDVSAGGPQFGYTERYITSVNNQAAASIASAIARTSNTVYICGMFNNRTFIASYSKNANLTPLNFRFYDDGEDVPEELKDIHFNLGQPNVVSVGYQQRSVAWNGSPAGQNYSWIVTLTPNGASNCRTSASALHNLITGTTPAATLSSGNGASAGNFQAFINSTFSAQLDNCVTPARLAADETSVQSTVYPNPGNGLFYINTDSEESMNLLLRITDVNGRTVHEQQLQPGLKQQLIDITALADGIYFWTLSSNNEKLRSDKLIIQH